MRVLVLGGTGYIGARLCRMMQADGRFTPLCTSRGLHPHTLRLDTCDEAALATALGQVEAVVNCVGGSRQAIAEGARVLARAAGATRLRSVVHLSSMAVYGERDGRVDETTPLTPARGWYARAKQEAEEAMGGLACAGGAVTVLRPGCVWGPASTLWVARIAQWLSSRRIGDLGAGGDGWTNGVHVDDVCRAALRALELPPAPGTLRTWNLGAPDSPRWNPYFCDLAQAIGAPPVRRIGPLRLRMDAMLAGPVLHLARRSAPRMAGGLPYPVTPQLIDLWARQLKMNCAASATGLEMEWTPYEQSLQQGAAWWLAACGRSVDARFA